MMNFKLITNCLIFILLSAKLYGQSVLTFEYDCNKDFVKPVQTDIKLRFPNGTTEKLFSDTIRSLEFMKKAYFKKSGNYMLSICTSGIGLKIDSASYPFTINGKETEVEIAVSFSENKSQSFKKGNWIETKEIPRGYISVLKYYKSPRSIKIKVNIQSVNLTAYFKKDSTSIKLFSHQ